MFNHVALLKPPLPQLNVELASWYITKSCFGVVHNIELGGGGGGGGGGDKVCFVNVQSNFVILAGMVSRVLSKIVVLFYLVMFPIQTRAVRVQDTKLYM
jgi:hypothetical protein